MNPHVLVTQSCNAGRAAAMQGLVRYKQHESRLFVSEVLETSSKAAHS